MHASVVIPTYNRLHYLRSTLLSIQTQTLSDMQCEIVVVDNGPAGKVREVVDELNDGGCFPVYHVCEPRIGLHYARHAGAQEARGEILVYVDDDIIAPPGWLRAMLNPYSDPLVACVGGKILPKWEAEPPAWLAQFGGNGGGNLSLLDLGDETLELAWPQTAYGCNMSVRRSVLYEVGGFHPDAIGARRLIWLRGDGETGLQRKIYDAGYKVIYEPRAWLYHRVPASRLRPEYFYWRQFIQGISDSYTHMRVLRLTRVRLLRHTGRCVYNAVQAYARSFRSPEQRIRYRATAWYWYGRAQHQLRISLSRKLCQHVLQDSYLEVG
jgi:glycosyltransferase involved in cell wall biosynthesis